MSLLNFYQRCCAVDWNFDYLEGAAWRRGNDAMEALRRDAGQSPAHQRIFDAVKLSQKSGSLLPQFGDLVPTDDPAALDEAIRHHEWMGQTYYLDAKAAEERASSDPEAVSKYFAHGAIERRLRDQRLALEPRRIANEPPFLDQAVGQA